MVHGDLRKAGGLRILLELLDGEDGGVVVPCQQSGADVSHRLRGAAVVVGGPLFAAPDGSHQRQTEAEDEEKTTCRLAKHEEEDTL